MIRSQKFNVRNQAGTVTAIFGTYKVGSRFITTCELGAIDAARQRAEVLGSGAAICAPGDICSRTVGEKKALAAASATFPRGVREAIQRELHQVHQEPFRRSVVELTVEALSPFDDDDEVCDCESCPGYGAGV